MVLNMRPGGTPGSGFGRKGGFRMKQSVITGEMKVWDVIQGYPQTFAVFRKHGCPDMKRGIFAISARFMKVRWAARMHKISPQELLRDLNAAVTLEPERTGEDEAAQSCILQEK